jgi:hypothetical protein
MAVEVGPSGEIGHGDDACAMEGDIVGALDKRGPSACRLARSMKAEDKDSSHGGRTEALPDGWPPLPSGEEPPTSPLARRRRRSPLSRLHIARAVVLIPHRRC